MSADQQLLVRGRVGLFLVVREQGLPFHFARINTQTDKFWQFSMAQFSLVVRGRETHLLAVLESQKVENR